MSARDLLDNIIVSSPCSADWESMVGNDLARFCKHCNLSVYHLSNLNRKQALRLIKKSRGRLCVRYELLPDGSIRTKPVSSSLHRIGRHASRLAAGAFGATLTVSAAAAATGPLDFSSVPFSYSRLNTPGSDLENNPVGAAIRGFIFDPNGAVISGAFVGLSDDRNKVALLTTTSSDGEYRFSGLEAGQYSLKIEANGFVTSVVSNIALRDEREDRFDQTLSVAGIEASVEVRSEVMELQLQGSVALPGAKEPLVRAAQNDDLEAVKQLLAAKPNANVRDQVTDATALEHAVLNSNREMVQLLIWAGADVNARDKGGRTPLMLLGKDVIPEIVWDLVNAGAKVNLRDNDGDTALTEAAESENVEVLKVLLDAGATVNVKNNLGRSPLMLAASEGLVNNVRTLILAGADFNGRDLEGKTAWIHALENEHKAVLRLLRSYGGNEDPEPTKEPKR